MDAQFTPRAGMLAHELCHSVMIPIPLSVAHVIRDELGEPAFRAPTMAAWYADAALFDAGQLHCSFPFCLRIDGEGNASLQVRFGWVHEMKTAMFTCIPEIKAEIAQPRRYQRA